MFTFLHFLSVVKEDKKVKASLSDETVHDLLYIEVAFCMYFFIGLKCHVMNQK